MEIQLKIDSKGRLHLPPEIREKIGETRKLATLKDEEKSIAILRRS